MGGGGGGGGEGGEKASSKLGQALENRSACDLVGRTDNLSQPGRYVLRLAQAIILQSL